jgi:hypothetical protein
MFTPLEEEEEEEKNSRIISRVESVEPVSQMTQ